MITSVRKLLLAYVDTTTTTILPTSESVDRRMNNIFVIASISTAVGPWRKVLCSFPLGEEPFGRKTDSTLNRVLINLTWRKPPAHTTDTQLGALDYFCSAGDPGIFRRPWRALEVVTCVV
ncbi:hypothetical protein TNCV_402371 [Trichonephila clavipes]|nr:hypothetical protein TNCV_402371 [Trichonephila clavipes]